MKIAYFTSRFPSSSEVPILNQVVGLIQAGYDITIFAEYEETNANHSDIEKYCLREKTIYFDKPPINNSKNKFIEKLVFIFKTIPKAIPLFFISPIKTARTFNFLKYGKYSTSFWLFYNAILFIKDKREFDIVFSQFGPNGEKAAILYDLGVLSAKIVTNFRGYDLNVVPNTSLFLKDYTFLKKHGDYFVCDSNFMKNKLVDLGFDNDKAQVVPSALQIEKFKFPLKQSKEKKKLKILSVGRLVECKGIEYGIKAIKLLAINFPRIEIEYLIIGNGPMYEELNSLVKMMNLDNVNFLGWKDQEELIEIMGSCDILLHPATVAKDGSEEAQGLVIQEAQALGVPVIASDIGGISDGLIDGKTGYLVPQKNPDMIVDKIVRIVENDEFKKLGDEGIKYVRSKYSQKEQIKKLTRIFSKLIKSY